MKTGARSQFTEKPRASVQGSCNLTGNRIIFQMENPVNRVHRPCEPAARRLSIVHDGPWTEAWPDLAGVWCWRS
jgi:hypothetical protein